MRKASRNTLFHGIFHFTVVHLLCCSGNGFAKKDEKKAIVSGLQSLLSCFFFVVGGELCFSIAQHSHEKAYFLSLFCFCRLYLPHRSFSVSGVYSDFFPY
jgi:hypothetical protein